MKDIEKEEEPGAEGKDQDDHQEFEIEEERTSLSCDNEEHEEGSNEENEVRLRSPIKRNLGNHCETSGTSLGVVCRSSRSMKGIKPLWFQAMR